MKNTQIDQFDKQVIFTQVKDHERGLNFYLLGKLYKINNNNYMIVSQEYDKYDVFYIEDTEFVTIDEAPEWMCPWTSESYEEVLAEKKTNNHPFDEFENKFGIAMEVVLQKDNKTKVSGDNLEIYDDGRLTNPTPGFEFL